ncbi:hypothetical protein BDA99DRAFT_543723 [Phascolomyces articulosus]|uniref:Transmembrane protein n=1 Tax=Phascolomyces articulosus TaxID=60185 RepID=A0AAD5P7E2_9FUNG|nr:hypothetical protein BDA99DRAFT_543723 [Phascolomyces articulosus]
MEGYQRTLLRHCNDQNVCHCDWRLTLTDCEESMAMYYINIVNIALCGLVVVVVIKGHSIWDHRHGTRGCLRPKPVDALLSMLMIFNALRLLSSVILVVDISPTNIIARSFMYEFPWQFGVGAFTLYMIGIGQTLADSHKVIATGWLPSPLSVDIIGLSLFISPFIIHNICSLIAGSFAYSNLWMAELFTHLLYGFWFLDNTLISFAVIFAGVRLINILKEHLIKFPASGPRYVAIKTGIIKIQMLVAITVICLMSFATLLLLYGILRNQIMINTAGSIFLGVVWSLLGPITTLSIELAIIINLSFDKNPAFGTSSSGSGGQHTNKDDKTAPYTSHNDPHYTTSFDQQQAVGTTTSSYRYSNDNNNTTNLYPMHTMKTNNITDQQMQYQELFEKHAISSNNNLNNASGERIKTYNMPGHQKKVPNPSPILENNEMFALYGHSPDEELYRGYHNDDDIKKKSNTVKDDSGSSKFELIVS